MGLEPARSLIVLIDLAGEESPQELFDAALEHFGQIDVLVNNAGWAPPRTPLLKTGATTQDRILAVNLRAPIALARLAAAQMVKNGDGTIVNIASAAARNAPAGEAVYAAAKAGLVAFSRAAFAELRSSGIKLTVIIPGLVDTALIPHNKHLDRALMLGADDVAEAVMAVLHAPARAYPLKSCSSRNATPNARAKARQATGSNSTGPQSVELLDRESRLAKSDFEASRDRRVG